MVLYFLLAVLSIAATVLCIVMETEWWIWAIFVGTALLCLAIAIAKLREELEYVRAARKPKAEKPKKPKAAKPKTTPSVNCPKQIKHCLSLSKEQLFAYTGRHYQIVFNCLENNSTHRNSNKSKKAVCTCLLCAMAADGVITQGEKELYRHFDTSMDLDTINFAYVQGEMTETAVNLARAIPTDLERNSFLALAAAVIAAGGVTPQNLAYFKRLMKATEEGAEE